MSSMAKGLPSRHRLTARDYHLMSERGILRPDARVELIEGEIIDMAPIGSRHAGAVERIADLLRAAAAKRFMVRTQQPVVLDEYSEPEPDIVLVPWRADYYSSAHPGPSEALLIVEVAETSVRHDAEVKVPLYARHGIREVWIVDLERRRIKRFVGVQAERYVRAEELRLDERVVLAAAPEVEVDLSGVFAE
jgi:Uma2 family endonuclease